MCIRAGVLEKGLWGTLCYQYRKEPCGFLVMLFIAYGQLYHYCLLCFRPLPAGALGSGFTLRLHVLIRCKASGLKSDPLNPETHLSISP